ncbi:Dyp-type peroxidase [Marinomonas mediterranea]|jgi:Dyp-type peroxidase family|uniref:Dyp-type peroxidase family n=1 Tax=Marinomonas mediterranea (strain ATCC 700492 / JCM 21426 / NBRC 103028 / MMB-1) TaxID=717774 RepID=F2JWP0_MARM1|nr:Dyp-type peroxidase [Marinomonas mediterranea]ADZ91804.1 Dyp-type peroxidase family [Marinomonas mediterranea MMB-1]WCN17897.1 Dyp-type peroxidase [Marinomonas mediterranea MMB-1]
MPIHSQSGVCAEASSDATFVSLNIVSGKENIALKALEHFLETVEKKQSQFAGTHLFATIGFSIYAWNQLFTQTKPKYLEEFPSFKGKYIEVGPEHIDICVHIRSIRKDATFSLTQAIVDLFGNSVEIVSQTDCFKYLDNRDLTGFVDGTENPQGESRAQTALIQDEDPEYRSGSYLNVMKFVHNLPKWETLSTTEQEQVYGRTKEDDIEFPAAEKSVHAHTKRASIKDQNGKSLEILRQSMPFGNLTEKGLMFASYVRKPEIFNQMLKSMIIGDEDGHSDHLMQYTDARYGSLFFVPSTSFFNQL